MAKALRILSTITSNPDRVEELRRGVTDLSERHGRPLQLDTTDLPGQQSRPLGDVEVLLTYRFSPEQLAAAPRLQWIHFGAAGVDHSLFPALLDSRIQLTTSKGIHGEVMGEYAVMALIGLAAGLPHMMDAQRRKVWIGRTIRYLHRPVAGSRLLVIGLGHVGRAVATRAAALGMQVRGVRRTPHEGPLPPGVTSVHTPEELDGLLPGCDYVVLCAPRTPTTEGLLDARRLGLLPEGAGIVNLARGALLDEEALLALLDAGHLGGAVLDCFGTEPLPEDSPLWHHPRVMVTPHISGNFEAYTRRVIGDFLQNLEHYLSGHSLEHPLNRQAGY